LSQGSSKSA
jgi:hypothetical protein